MDEFPTRPVLSDRELSGSGIPDQGCAYAQDWFDFLNGHR
jgi:hypothetical protein